MIKLLDFMLCSGVVLAELTTIFFIAIVVQAVLYRGFGINPYKILMAYANKIMR